MDSEYKRGSDYTGNLVAGAPKFVAAARVAYAVPQLPGLKLRADVKYTGATMLGASNKVEVSDYAIVNIGATYDTRLYGYETTFRAGINNVADKRYWLRSEEHTSELQSLMRISYAVFCLKKKTHNTIQIYINT